jgi:hypothetical protein
MVLVEDISLLASVKGVVVHNVPSIVVGCAAANSQKIKVLVN